MFNLGEYVSHKTTGQLGKVFGYGHQMMDGAYLPTLTVRIIEGSSIRQNSFVEDLSSEWVRAETEKMAESLSNQLGALV